MAPRIRQGVPPKVQPPTGTGKPDSAHARRSRTHVQTRTGSLQEEDQFDLDAISSSEDDYEPPCDDHGCNPISTTQGEDSRNHVNDPDTIPLPKTTANDICHFFDKSGDKVVCKICRQVFLHSPLFSFLN
jgi:hypothetical protein